MTEEINIKSEKYYKILEFNRKINKEIKQRKEYLKDWWNTSVKYIEGIYL